MQPLNITPITWRTAVTPSTAIPTLQKHMLIDGFDVVVDLKRSKGSYIIDARDGKRYLDFFTFVASSPIGLNHPKMTTPEFLEELASVAVNKPSNSDISTLEQAEFLETFVHIAIPSYLPHLFLVEGGTLGVENALKAAFDWKIRKNFAKGYKEERGTKVLHFRQAFHGRSGYTLSLTNTDPVKTDLYPKFAWPRVLNPAISFPLHDSNLQKVVRDEKTSLEQMKEAFRSNKDDIASIIIEPIQGEGGDNHFRNEFFVSLRELADENDVMLIFDEVQTGVGLTGRMWGHQHFSVKPDMITFGKKTQVCGFLCGTRIDEVKENVFVVPSRINSTWGGNLVDMVRAQRYLQIIDEEKLVENARVVGDYLLSRLQELSAEFPSLISNARARGLFAAFDILPERRTAFRNKCMEKGLIILPSGEKSIRFRPPLNVSKGEIDEGMGIIQSSLREMV
jgi:L-lysine 6-transaminase